MIKNYDNLKRLSYKEEDVFLHFTGNVFGIGCSALNKNSISKISKLKNRTDNKGFIVLFASIKQAIEFGFDLLKDNFRINSLVNQYSPGNVTFILKSNNDIFNNISINNEIALRIPSSKFLRIFITKINQPIVSTSVNISGTPLINDIDIIKQKFNSWFDYSILSINEKKFDDSPSTIIRFIKPTIQQDYVLECLREGSILKEEIDNSWQQPVIQFVCVGNICRSPLAELYTKKRFKEENLIFKVESSGLIDNPTLISKHSQTILRQNDINAEHKYSRQISQKIIQRSTYILCMTRNIKDTLLNQFDNIENKVFTYAEFTNNSIDITDPYGLDFSAYQKSWDLIKKYTEDLIKILKGKI
ncbi:MAG: Sua5/YciO/YrdC/YwlC family protein [Candidatus Cloacimonetes bacterium]|nr:Sua5/YciO/YrdC/YwlC family protein [Candidatus Cloacimonadota bacterium]